MLRKDPAKRPFASQLLLDPVFKELATKPQTTPAKQPKPISSNIDIDAPQ